MRLLSTLLGSGWLFLSGTAILPADDKIIAHEWGTFTCLQDEQGHAIGGINVDDEPVPSFVCWPGGIQVAAQYSQDVRNFGLPPYSNGKGWVAGDPRVTMRLETPVLYLYPPQGQDPRSVPLLDVQVQFHGGVLSQFYPYAHIISSKNPNGQIVLADDAFSGGKMPQVSLDWKDVRLGSTEKPVETDDIVWTTPREVSAPVLELKAPVYDPSTHAMRDGIQAEHFLFYRGVGHLDSPLTVQTDGEANGNLSVTAVGINDIAAAWLVEIRSDGRCASRGVGDTYEIGDGKGGAVNFSTPHLHSSFSSGGNWAYPSSPGKFADSDFSPANLTQLKASMQAALIQAGLYPDEASAMLRTWELSYFKSPGLRFFYIVPRAWVDKVLPLKITGAPADLTRVMIGRVELITEQQKAALLRLSAGPCPDLPAFKKACEAALQNSKLPADQKEDFYRGERPLSELGIPLQPLVQDYLSLGRFRDALIVHAQHEHPSLALAQFIKDNRLSPVAP